MTTNITKSVTWSCQIYLTSSYTPRGLLLKKEKDNPSLLIFVVKKFYKNLYELVFLRRYSLEKVEVPTPKINMNPLDLQ